MDFSGHENCSRRSFRYCNPQICAKMKMRTTYSPLRLWQGFRPIALTLDGPACFQKFNPASNESPPSPTAVQDFYDAYIALHPCSPQTSFVDASGPYLWTKNPCPSTLPGSTCWINCAVAPGYGGNATCGSNGIWIPPTGNPTMRASCAAVCPSSWQSCSSSPSFYSGGRGYARLFFTITKS